MKVQTVIKDEMKVIGIATITTNIKDEGMMQAFMLWGEFLGKNLAERIPNRINPHIRLGVYFDYEKNFCHSEGKYSFLAGVEVDSLESIPEGMVGITIPKAKYAVFTAKGEMKQEIQKTWKSIWTQWPIESGMERAYTVDMEVFDSSRFYNGDQSELDIYISVK
ncbi:MAG: GyrI-like domain-containing protein [Clostridia bacterium]|nr:GyrI-like domain-containing protein [Clostridia bacterium]